MPPELQSGDNPVFERTFLSIAQYIITHHYYGGEGVDIRNYFKTAYECVKWLAEKIAEYNQDKQGKRVTVMGDSSLREKIDFLTTPKPGGNKNNTAPLAPELVFSLYLTPVEKILIPSKKEFESAVFSHSAINVIGDEPINIMSSILSADILKNDETLEKIARGINVDTSKIPESSLKKVLAAMNELEISGLSEAVEKGAYRVTAEDPNMVKAVKTFQQDYMNTPKEKCSGKLDQETVFFMNEALNNGWNIRKENIYYLARTLYGEARGVNTKTKEAIAWTIRNRGDEKQCTIKSVVTQRNQYTAWRADDPNYQAVLDPESHSRNNPLDQKAWEECRKIARQVLGASKLTDITQGSTHYYDDSIEKPFWSNPENEKKAKEVSVKGAVSRVHFYKGVRYAIPQ